MCLGEEMLRKALSFSLSISPSFCSVCVVSLRVLGVGFLYSVVSFLEKPLGFC